MLYFLLLDTAPVDFMATLKVVGIVLLWVVASASSIEKIWLWFTGGIKKKDEATSARFEKLEQGVGQFVDKEALEKRFAAIEEKAAKQGMELANQHNTLMEYLRERERLSGMIQGRLNQVEEKVHVLEIVPSRVDKLEAKLDNVTSQINDLKLGQRELKQELRADMKSNKDEVLAAIKGLKP